MDNTIEAIKDVLNKRAFYRNGKLYIVDNDNERLLTDEEYLAIESKVNELDSNDLSIKYKVDRKKAYDLLNQDELRFDDIKYGTTTWIDSIDEIKTRYPKPTS